MSKRSSAQSRVKKHELTQRMKALASAALAQKVGYLRVDDLPEARIFEKLPTQSFNAHRIIRGTDELFLLRHGLVEIWHTRHDFMVKELTIGMLFGEMPLLGQTMLGTRAITGTSGATVAVMDVNMVKQWLEAAPVPIVEKIGRRLADVEAEHYRSCFQSSDSRIAALLLDLAREGSTILGVTHEDIAERLGVYRETVTIILDSMRSQRLIDIGRKRISIVNKRALKELSEL
ncbi:MAG: Crp/Fnr family transcriptional regulator [Blastocatellia bacterium]